MTDYTRPKMRELSTAHLMASDLPLLLDKNAPQLMAIHVNNFGSFFSVDSGDLEEITSNLKGFGFSEAFVSLYTLCCNEGYSYLYLDGDAMIDDSLPTFEH